MAIKPISPSTNMTANRRSNGSISS
jgi:hypothetical protein